MVYFKLARRDQVSAELGMAIKIGFTRNHKERDREHEQSKLGIRVPVEDLCKVRGLSQDEKAVHRYFRRHVVEGETELFHPHDDLVDYIRWLRDEYYVWVPDDSPPCEDIEEHEAADSDQWLPSPDRRKERPRELNLFNDYGPLCLPPRILTVDDFYTDESILDAARQALGGIDLDPASHPVANRKVRASRFFTKYDDGLSRAWSGRVWLNPPFSLWKSWVPKIVSEWQSGSIESMCVLCATRTLTAQYFAPVHRNSNALCVFAGRIAFWGGLATGSPDDGHAVFYFGRDVDRFAKAFGTLGQVYLTDRGA